MIELYFKLKVLLEYIIPACIGILVIVGLILWVLITVLKENRIDKYMKDHGYEYYLRNVASYGNKRWYAYRKDNKSVDVDQLYRMKIKDIKNKYK